MDANQGGEYQKKFRQSVSAQVVACLAVVTLIKDCQQNLEITQQTNHFFTFSGPTGLLNTGIQTFCLCIPTDKELSYRLSLSLHSIIAVFVYPSLINSWLLDLVCYSTKIQIYLFSLFSHKGRKTSQEAQAGCMCVFFEKAAPDGMITIWGLPWGYLTFSQQEI